MRLRAKSTRRRGPPGSCTPRGRVGMVATASSVPEAAMAQPGRGERQP